MPSPKTIPNITNTELLDDFVSEPLCIMDAITDKVLYLNSAGKSIFNVKGDYTTKKCHEVFANSKSPCKDCLGAKMAEGSPEIFRCLKHNDILHQTYLLSSCYVKYKGKLARAESMSSLPKNYSEEQRFNESLRFEELLNKASSLVVNAHNAEQTIIDGLALIADFFESDNAFVFEKEDDIFVETYEWSKPGFATRKKTFQKVPATSIMPFFGKDFLDHKCINIPDVDKYKDTDFPLYETFKKEGIKSLLLQPLFEDQELSGFFGIENPAHRDIQNYALTALSLNLAALLSQEKIVEELSKEKDTGLPTGEFFWIEVGEYLSNKDKQYLLAKIDISHFRATADFFGHNFSSEIMKKAGKLLLSSFPDVVVASHIAQSDQFFILFNDGPAKAYETITKLGRCLSSLRHNLRVDFHVGFYLPTDPDEDPASMDEKLALANREAHDNSSVPYVIYDKSMSERNIREIAMVAEFPLAIAKDEFVVYIQPKYDMSRKCFFGGEALVRWKKGDKLIPPGEFIPVFEKFGLISDLDRYVFLHVLAYLQAQLSKNKEMVPISVNFSRVDLADETLADRIVAMIDAYKVPRQLVQLEITESAYVENGAAILSFIEKCHKAGLFLIMDDFGSGYSSLNSLKSLDIDGLKIDYKFFNKGSSLTKRNSIISCMVSLARSLNIRLTVEGVSEKEDAIYLQSLGAFCIQGYYFARPMPMEEFAKLDRRMIKNASAPVDSSAYDEIMDPKSPLNRLFNNSLTYLGVYRFSENGFFQLMDNKKLSHDRSESVVNDSPDMLQSVAEDDRDGLKQYLSEVCDGSAKEDHFDYTRITPAGGFRVRCRAFLLKKGEVESVVFFEVLRLSSLPIGEHARESFTEETISALCDSDPYPVVGISENKRIAYFNKPFLEAFPSSEVGAPCETIRDFTLGCDHCPLIQGQDFDIYVPASKLRYAVHSHKLLINGVPSILARFAPIEESHNPSATSENERLSRAIFSVIDNYCDVDLSDGSFKFAARSSMDGSITYREGDKDAYNTFFVGEANRRIEDIPLYLRFISLESLKERSMKGIYASSDFKIKNKLIYKKLLTSYFPDEKGHTHAMLFGIDSTSEHLKDIDSLTGLLNRSEGRERVDEFLKENYGKKCYLAIIDLDNFKSFNDRFGHPMGDKLLLGTANILLSLGEGWKFASRLGGDEFSILYSDEGKRLDYKEFRELLTARLVDLSSIMGLGENLDATAGIASYPQEGISFDDLYHEADENLYELKLKKGTDR